MHIADLTRAESLAIENFDRNLTALRDQQPRLLAWIEDQPLDGEWVFARDGALSLRNAAGEWFGGCSVPRRRSELTLQSLDVKGSVCCFLHPTHAADLAVALRKLSAAQAIVALVPSYLDAAVMLHSHDFSDDLAAGRLYVVAGAAWEIEFERLLAEKAGLAAPGSFVRLPHADEATLQPLIQSAQAIISRIGEQRAAQIAQLRIAYTPPGKRRVCVVAPMKFRLWSDFGSAVRRLQTECDDLEIVTIDADRPDCATPHALLAQAGGCDALLTMNTSRTDLPGVMPTDLPWITWVTGARIPSAALAGDGDRLLVVHPSLQAAAVSAGWPADQVQVASWPAVSRPISGRRLALIADTQPLDTPADLKSYSSHIILWESIRAELLRNPFALRRVDEYLQTRQQALGIVDAAFSHGRFVEQLIVPAYVQGLAATLQAANVAFDVWGGGWDSLETFASAHRGVVGTQTELADALDDSVALIHPLVPRVGHPILRCGLPVAAATDAAGLVRLARQALSGRLTAYADPSPQLDATVLGRIVDEFAAYA